MLPLSKPRSTAFHILVVEDNAGDARLITEALRDAAVNAEVHIVENGTDALDFLQRSGSDGKQRWPSIVLLDLNLPQLDGFDVLRAVKSDAALRSLPVIVFSSSGDARDVAKAYALRANAYVAKPMILDEYLRCVRVIVGFWSDVASRTLS